MKRHILMVDDEEDLEFVVRQRFDKEMNEGVYEFSFARDGQSALDFFHPQAPYVDLMLTDIQMPGMTCLELLERIAYLSPSTVRVILSGFFDVDYIRQAMHRGVSDVVQKPFHFKELDTMLGKLPPPPLDPEHKKTNPWPTGFRLMRVPHLSILWSAELVTPEGFYVMVLPDVPTSTYSGAAGYHWAYIRNTLSCVARLVSDPLDVLRTMRRQIQVEEAHLPMAFCRLDNKDFSLICEDNSPFSIQDSLRRESEKSLQFSITFCPPNQEPHPLFIAEIDKKSLFLS